MHKPELVLKNETHEILCDFEIQMNHLIPDTKSDLVLINKKKRTYCLYHFTVPTDHKVKIKESEEKWQIPGPCQRTKNTMKHMGDGDTNWSWWIWNRPKQLEISGRIETIQTTAILRYARILRRVLAYDERLITMVSNSNINRNHSSTNRVTTIKNGKKNNCMDTSSYKRRKLYIGCG